MATPSLRYDILADDKTAKGINSAKKNISGLDKSLAKLGKQIGTVFAAQKLYSFAKSSAAAFMEDQKSAALLANTVKNLGLAFETPGIEDFINRLSLAAGVADDQLRPAMQALLTTTGSVSKSQELLTQAIDISRGSSTDLATVVDDLSQAYVGNVKGLKKYNTGLTQAELKASSFAEIQAKLNKQFNGASAAYLDTYAGKMDLLKTAAGEAKETIGKGLLDAITSLSGKNGVQGLANSFGEVATQIAGATTALSDFVGQLNDALGSIPGSSILDKLGSSTFAKNFAFGGSLFAMLAQKGTKPRATGASTIDDYNMTANAKAQAAARAKAEAAAKKRAKDILAAQQKADRLAREQALLKKQSALFDLQQIELVAALQGKLSDDERKRAELQLALLQGNETAAAKLSTEIANSIDKTGNLAKYLQTLPDAANPFKSWDAYLTAIEERIKKITDNPPSNGYSMGDNSNGAGYTGSYDFSQNPATGGSIWDSYTPATNVQPLTPADIARLAAPMSSGSSTIGDYLNVVLQIDGKTIAEALQNQSLSGNNTTVNRTTGNFSSL